MKEHQDLKEHLLKKPYKFEIGIETELPTETEDRACSKVLETISNPDYTRSKLLTTSISNCLRQLSTKKRRFTTTSTMMQQTKSCFTQKTLTLSLLKSNWKTFGKMPLLRLTRFKLKTLTGGELALTFVKAKRTLTRTT